MGNSIHMYPFHSTLFNFLVSPVCLTQERIEFRCIRFELMWRVFFLFLFFWLFALFLPPKSISKIKLTETNQATIWCDEREKNKTNGATKRKNGFKIHLRTIWACLCAICYADWFECDSILLVVLELYSKLPVQRIDLCVCVLCLYM